MRPHLQPMGNSSSYDWSSLWVFCPLPRQCERLSTDVWALGPRVLGEAHHAGCLAGGRGEAGPTQLNHWGHRQ